MRVGHGVPFAGTGGRRMEEPACGGIIGQCHLWVGVRSLALSSGLLSAPVRLELPSQLTSCEPANAVSDREELFFL